MTISEMAEGEQEAKETPSSPSNNVYSINPMEVDNWEQNTPTMAHEHEVATWESLLRAKYDNYNILKMTTIAFTIFMVFEIGGGFLSNSISLLEDAMAMVLDVVSYLLNIYAEGLKLQNRDLSEMEAFLVETAIPLTSVVTLVALCMYFMFDALHVLNTDVPSGPDTVDVGYMYFFSILNGIIDVVCVWAFSSQGVKVFYDRDNNRKEDTIEGNTEMRPTRATRATRGKDFDESRSLLGDEEQDGHEEAGVGGGAASTGTVTGGAPSKRGRVGSFEAYGQKNMVMITAASHVGGDTVRTLAVFAAAGYSSWSGTHADICDAWAAILSCITILIACFYMLGEIVKQLVQQRGHNCIGIITTSSSSSSSSSSGRNISTSNPIQCLQSESGSGAGSGQGAAPHTTQVASPLKRPPAIHVGPYETEVSYA